MENNALFDRLVQKTLQNGAFKAAVIPVSEVVLDASFRALCESNACGKFGRCWMCPPDVGDIEALMASLGAYTHALVYQTVGELEDSFDIEGMADAAAAHNSLAEKLSDEFRDEPAGEKLLLSAGGCHLCPVCSKIEGEPCRHPDKALPSLEAYGVNVSRLAASSGMKYINGQNTVTYFGALFFVLE